MLKKLRKQKGLTQIQLSEISGVSQSYISYLEKKHFVNSPTVRQIVSISRALDIDKVKLFLYFADKEIE